MHPQPNCHHSHVQDAGTEAHDALDLAVELKVQIVLCCARREAPGPLRPDSMPILHPCMLKSSGNIRRRARRSPSRVCLGLRCQARDRVAMY